MSTEIEKHNYSLNEVLQAHAKLLGHQIMVSLAALKELHPDDVRRAIESHAALITGVGLAAFCGEVMVFESGCFRSNCSDRNGNCFVILTVPEKPLTAIVLPEDVLDPLGGVH